MKKTIIAVATLAAAVTLAQTAVAQTFGHAIWNTENTNLAGDELVFNGTDGSNAEAKHEWTNAQLFIQGTNNTIKGGALEFVSQNPIPTSGTPGTAYNAVVLGGDSTLTIDVGTLTVGESVVNGAEGTHGADRGIRLSGSNNTLNIFADRIVSYTGDEFVHVRSGDGSSVANIGSADRRIGYFEAHTGWGKKDWGVAILQVNEGNTINFWADEAHFDGSTFTTGGVFGSGDWGTLNVDANKLFIDGNLCGNYGTTNKENTVFLLNVHAQSLELKGDVNAGSMNVNSGDIHSDHSRTTVINLSADQGTFDGDINAYERGNIGVFSANGLEINGKINLVSNGQVVLGGVVDKDDRSITVGGSLVYSGDVSVKEDAQMTFGGTVDMNAGNISVADNGVVSVDGRLTAKNSILTFTGGTSTVATFAADAKAATSSNLVLKDGSYAEFKSVETSQTTSSIGSNATLVLNTDSTLGNVSFTNDATGTVVFNDGTSTIGEISGKANVAVGTNASVTVQKAADASITAVATSALVENLGSAQAAALKAAQKVTLASSGDAGTTAANSVAAAESEAYGSYFADLDANGNVVAGSEKFTVNSKTLQIGEVTAFNVLAWRAEMNDMNKRLGELRDSEGKTGVWARFNAGKQEYGSSKNNFQQLQFGADTTIEAVPGLHLGSAFSYTSGDLSYATGSGDNDIYGLAAYASWLGESGSFVDVIAKVARLETDATVAGTSADFNTNAYSVSAEIGHRFDVASFAFIEPQLELSYGRISGETFDTVSASGLRAATEVESVDSLVGRAGFRAGLTCPNNKGNVYVRASVLREFDGDVTVKRGDGAYEQDMGDTWFEYGLGANWNPARNSQIYVDVERSSSADLSEPWRFNIGARYAF